MQNVTRIAAVALVVLAVVLAIAAFGIARRAGTTAGPAPATATATTAPAAVAAGEPVLVAARALRAGDVVGPRDVTIQRLDPRPAGALEHSAQAVGGVLVHDLEAGRPVAAHHLARGLPTRLEAGERALAVPVDEIAGVGNRVSPGDYVDVFLTLRDGGRGSERQQTRLLLSRLRVLGYGADDLAVDADAAPAEAPEPADARAEHISGSASASRRQEPAPGPARSAVLAVPVGDVHRLLLAAQSGKLSLALRHPADPGLPDPGLFPQPRNVLAARSGLDADQRAALTRPENEAYAGIDLRSLAGAAPATPPSRPPAPRRAARAAGGVEIIRGDGRGGQP